MSITTIEVDVIEISGEALNSCLSGFPDYLRDIAHTILYTHDVGIPENGKWYNFSNYLNALQEIGSTYGGDTLYAIGKASLDCAIKPEVPDLTEAIKNLQAAFTLNHRNGVICFINIEELNVAKKRVEIWIENPYPHEINKGILTAVAREYNPYSSIPEVVIDESTALPTRAKYCIKW